jgi:hypothetical protein
MKKLLIAAFLMAVAFNISAQIEDELSGFRADEKGILIKKVTELEKNSIVNPDEGLMVYQTTSPEGFHYYNGSEWLMLSVSSQVISKINDDDLDTRVETEKNPDEDLIKFYIAGLEKWRITERAIENRNSGNSLFLGKEAGMNDDLSFKYNTFVGNASGRLNVDGELNTAIGFQTLSNSVSSNLNIAIGHQALKFNLSGNENTSIGVFSMLSNTDGYQNVSVGSFSAYSNTSGFANTSLGTKSFFNNTTGSKNLSVCSF